jgi:hypothetical protein
VGIDISGGGALQFASRAADVLRSLNYSSANGASLGIGLPKAGPVERDHAPYDEAGPNGGTPEGRPSD